MTKLSFSRNMVQPTMATTLSDTTDEGGTQTIGTARRLPQTKRNATPARTLKRRTPIALAADVKPSGHPNPGRANGARSNGRRLRHRRGRRGWRHIQEVDSELEDVQCSQIQPASLSTTRITNTSEPPPPPNPRDSTAHLSACAGGRP